LEVDNVPGDVELKEIEVIGVRHALHELQPQLRKLMDLGYIDVLNLYFVALILARGGEQHLSDVPSFFPKV